MRTTLVKKLENILLVVTEIKKKEVNKMEIKENNVNKAEMFKEDSIICKMNEIKRMNRKGKNLLLQCVNLKYSYDITWNNANSYKGPFVFNENIDYQKFGDDYFEATTMLKEVITKGTYFYDYRDIVNNDDFNVALEECLANYFVLYAEYQNLLCNIQDFTDAGCSIESSVNSSEIMDIMKNIITTINLSSWKNLSCCKSLVN